MTDRLSRCMSQLLDIFVVEDDPMTSGSDCEGLIHADMDRRARAVIRASGYTVEELEAEIASRLSPRSAHEWSCRLVPTLDPEHVPTGVL